MNANVRFRFDCIFYYVRDLDRSVEFYQRMLGLRLESRDDVARFRIDGVLFELVPVPVPGIVGSGGNARLCLAVDDINEAKTCLEACQVHVSSIRTVSNGALAHFEDPDGNEIVIWQYA